MIEILRLNSNRIRQRINELALILHDCVGNGASVGFMNPFDLREASKFYEDTATRCETGELVFFAAIFEGKAVGTVQLVPSQKPNQPHRADLVKMLVHSKYRRLGIGKKLLESVDFEAKQRGITLITLDTAAGSDAERLYIRAGYQKAGTIPDYALWPDGGYCDTTYYYKRIG